MTKTSKKKYIQGIIENDRKTVTEIINKFLPKIKALIKRNNGSSSEGENIFYEGLHILVEKIYLDPDIPIPDDKFFAYLRRICFNKWMDELKRKGKFLKNPIQDSILDDSQNLIELNLEQVEKHRLFMQKFNLLNEGCQKLLKYFFVEKLRDKEIAELLNISTNFVRVKRNRCKEKLKILLG